MPYREQEIERLYWTMSQAAEELGVKESFIRFYDAELNLDIYRGSRQARKLSKDDMEMMRSIIAVSKYCSGKGIKQLISENKFYKVAALLK